MSAPVDNAGCDDRSSQAPVVDTRFQIRQSLPLDTHIRSEDVVADSECERDNFHPRRVDQGR